MEDYTGNTQYDNMNTIILTILFMDLEGTYALGSVDDGKYIFDYSPKTGNNVRFHLLNGQYQPTICLETNAWTKFQILYSKR